MFYWTVFKIVPILHSILHDYILSGGQWRGPKIWMPNIHSLYYINIHFCWYENMFLPHSLPSCLGNFFRINSQINSHDTKKVHYRSYLLVFLYLQHVSLCHYVLFSSILCLNVAYVLPKYWRPSLCLFVFYVSIFLQKLQCIKLSQPPWLW